MPYGRENLFIQCCAQYLVKFCETDVRSEVKSDIVFIMKEIQIRTLLGGKHKEWKALCTARRSVSCFKQCFFCTQQFLSHVFVLGRCLQNEAFLYFLCISISISASSSEPSLLYTWSLLSTWRAGCRKTLLRPCPDYLHTPLPIVSYPTSSRRWQLHPCL